MRPNELPAVFFFHARKKMSFRAKLLSRMRHKIRAPFVPLQENKSILPEVLCTSDGGVEVGKIKNHEAVEEYTWRTFYTEAPIPKAFGLADKNANNEVKDFIKREVSDYLHSGVSLQMSLNGRIVGINLALYMEKNFEYEILGENMSTWHNTAADLISKGEVDDLDPIVAWRIAQFNHAYDAMQIILRKENKDFGIYAGASFIDHDLRNAKVFSQMVRGILSKVKAGNGFTAGVTTTSLNEKALKAIQKVHEAYDKVAYADQKLCLNGKYVLKELSEECGDIALIVKVP